MAMKYYKAPVELPSGFWEAIQPLAKWLHEVMKEAYDRGYYDGKADASITWSSIINDRRTPPSGSAVVTK